MQCQPVQERLALKKNYLETMPPFEQKEIISRGETLKIIARNYKYRLAELKTQIDSLNQSIELQRDSNKMIESLYQNGDASIYEKLQSMSLLRDTESRLISFKYELEREQGYQKLVQEYCKKKTN